MNTNNPSINPCTLKMQLDFRHCCSHPSRCLLSEQHSNELKTVIQAAGREDVWAVKVEPEAQFGPRFHGPVYPVVANLPFGGCN